MISSRQSVTCVASVGLESSASSTCMQPSDAAPPRITASVAQEARFILRISTSVARGVEPPLGADAEEVLDRAQAEDVVHRVEGAGAGVAEGHRPDEADLRAAVVAA